MTVRMFGEPEPPPAPSAAPDAMAEFREPEPVSQLQEAEPASQLHDSDPASQVHEPEPEWVSQLQELEPVAQLPEPEPVPQFHIREDYSEASVEEASEQSAMARAPEPSVRYVPPETEQHGAAERGPLLSSATIAAVDSAFNALAHTVLVQNARTLEDLVREMLRPMLKTWLDDNLPGLVERLVRAEIERVARGR